MSEQAWERRREEIRSAESTGSGLLWFGMLAGPTAWSIQMLVNYNMEESFLCAPAKGEQGELFGLSLNWWVTAVNIGVTLLVIVGLVAAAICWRRLRPSSGGETTAGRASWMATAGVILGVGSLFVVGVGFAPAFILDACQSPL